MGLMGHMGLMGRRVHLSPVCPISPISSKCQRMAHAEKSPSTVVKILGICSPTDLNARTERLGAWLRFLPVRGQFRRELH
jgi:hypothetical protein